MQVNRMKIVRGERMPSVLVREPGAPAREVQLTKDELVIGRDQSAPIAVGLPNSMNPVGIPDISRAHARLIAIAGRYAVIDTSKNGTFLQGHRLTPNQPVQLHDGYVIRIGDQYGNSVSLTFRESARAAKADTEEITFTALGGRREVYIGRDPASDLHLPSPAVSRRHAVINLTSRGYEIADLGSTNGTYVNGSRISKTLLRQGDEILIGPFKITFNLDRLQRVSSVANTRLDAISIFKEVRARRGPKTLLNDVSLAIHPREFVALVGGSGAGKSTLLCALNGAKPPTKGHVLVNGDDLYANYGAYRTNMGYVPQSDVVHSRLTVRKALKYTAQLRLPPDTSEQEVDHRIDEVLKIVDLLPQKDQMISKLSGGQRKRVNIAAELIAEPNLLFLDEPTSGLDPGLDKKMMRTLNEIADEGRTVVLVTHATTNITDACDKIAFLSHGRLVFFGPPNEALRFFNSPDFATIYAKVEQPNDAQAAEKRFRASSSYQQHVVNHLASRIGPPPDRLRKPHKRQAPTVWLRQLSILTRRYFELMLNDRFSLLALLGVMPLIGILLLIIADPKSFVGGSQADIRSALTGSGGTGVYNVTGGTQTLLHIMALTVIILGVFAAAYELIKERAIYERERMMNLNIGSYVLSKIVTLFSFGCIQCLAFLAVLSFKVQFPQNGVLFSAPMEIYITLLLGDLSGICLGLLVSAIVDSSDTVVYMMLVIIVFQIVFSGAMLKLPDAAQPISYLTQTRWTMEGLGSTVNMNALNQLNQMFVPQVKEIISTPLHFYINYDSTTDHLLQTWFSLILFAIVFATLAGIILKRRDAR